MPSCKEDGPVQQFANDLVCKHWQCAMFSTMAQNLRRRWHYFEKKNDWPIMKAIIENMISPDYCCGNLREFFLEVASKEAAPTMTSLVAPLWFWNYFLGILCEYFWRLTGSQSSRQIMTPGGIWNENSLQNVLVVVMKMVLMFVIRMKMTIAVVIKMIDRSNNKYWPSIIASAYERESEKEYQDTYCGVAFHIRDSIMQGCQS